MQCQSHMKTPMVGKRLILVEPNNFKVNPETVKDNTFMKEVSSDQEVEIQSKVIKEHQNYQEELKKWNIPLKVYPQINPEAYDSIFACEMVSGIKNEDFPEGILFMFPMRWPSRRIERNNEIIEELKQTYKYVEDLSYFQEKDMALESYGAISIDFHNRIVYCGLSERGHQEPAECFVKLLNKYTKQGEYKLRLIENKDPKTNLPCFHASTYLHFQNDLVIYCKDFITDPLDAERIYSELTEMYDFKYQVILISYEEAVNYCAMPIEVHLEGNEKTGLLISRLSYNTYSDTNLKTLKEKYEVIVVDTDTIDNHAGGSLRCMTQVYYS
jgi:hypothetical protein